MAIDWGQPKIAQPTTGINWGTASAPAAAPSALSTFKASLPGSVQTGINAVQGAANLAGGFFSGGLNSIAKAALGVPQLALKGVGKLADVLSPGASAPLKPAIGGIDTLKAGIDKQQAAQFPTTAGKIGAGLGDVAGTVATFAAPGGAITKAQDLVAGAKAVPWILQKIAAPTIEAVGTGATELAASGGDKNKAISAGLGAGILSTLGRTGAAIYRKVIPQTVKENVAGMLSYTGKQRGQALAAGKPVEDGTLSLTSLVGMNHEKPFQVTDENSLMKSYDPTNASASETLQAYYQMMQRAYKGYTDMAKQAGDAGAFVAEKDLAPVITALKKETLPEAGAGYNSKAKALIRQIEGLGTKTKDGKVDFGNVDPDRVQQMIQKINTDVNPGSDAAGAKLAQETSKQLRDMLDQKIEKATGAQYQDARNVYSRAKTLEPEMVRIVKNSLKQQGVAGSFVDGLATIDMVQGLLTGNPHLAIRGLAIGSVKAGTKALRDPLIKLNRALSILSNGEGAASPISDRFLGSSARTAAAPSQTPKSAPLSQGKVSPGVMAGIGAGTALAATAAAAAPGTATTYEAPVQQPQAQQDSVVIPDRGVTVKKAEADTLRKVLFAEISNRNPEKQTLEAHTIINTILNRMKQSGKSLQEVITQPNQYQGYGSREYQRISSGKTTANDAQKLKAIDSTIQKLLAGDFPDNISGWTFYHHNPDGSITATKKFGK